MRRTLSALTVAVALAAAACSGGATAPTAETQPPAGPTEPPASAGAEPCAPTGQTGAVSASIVDFSFSPAAVTAKVGDTIVWTNEGEAPHTATLDDHPDCTTARLAGGDSGGVQFTAAGTYAFHCAVHPSMRGTIEVTQ